MASAAESPAVLFESYAKPFTKTSSRSCWYVKTSADALVAMARTSIAAGGSNPASTAAEVLFACITAEWNVLQMRASQIADPAVLAAAKWPLDGAVPTARDKALTSAFGAASKAGLDHIQAQLVGWAWALEAVAILRSKLGAGDGVDKDVAEGTTSALAENLLERMLSSGLTGGDVKGDGGHEERSPFATLLRQHFPSASLARSAASTSDDASSGLSEYPPPVVVEGLPVSLARLCGLYRYAGQHEGRCYFECKASGYFAYFDPTDKRWFVGPKLGDRSILCYKEVATAGENAPSAAKPLMYWDGKVWSTSDCAKMVKVPDRMWDTTMAARGTKRARTD